MAKAVHGNGNDDESTRCTGGSDAQETEACSSLQAGAELLSCGKSEDCRDEDDANPRRRAGARSSHSHRDPPEGSLDCSEHCSRVSYTHARTRTRSRRLVACPRRLHLLGSLPLAHAPWRRPTGHQSSSESQTDTPRHPLRPADPFSLLPTSRLFVNETFAKCTDANRPAVEKELKAAIYQAFERKELWSTDWKNFKLETCASSVCITRLIESQR